MNVKEKIFRFFSNCSGFNIFRSCCLVGGRKHFYSDTFTVKFRIKKICSVIRVTYALEWMVVPFDTIDLPVWTILVTQISVNRKHFLENTFILSVEAFFPMEIEALSP